MNTTTKTFPLEPIEKASIDELRALQLQRLRATLAHAYAHSPVYKAKFDAAGVHPDDCRSLEDLARFPFTTKQDLRDHYPFGMFAVPREQLVRIHASSGTTGKPTVVGYTRKDIDTWADVVARSFRAAGARPGDMLHQSYGYGLFTGGMGAHYGAERLGLTVVPFGGGQTEKQIQLILDFKPDIITVTPSYMLAICEQVEHMGLDPKELSLRIGIFGAEPWTNEMRQAIEKRMAIDAVDIYGLSEVMGPGVANECVETKDGPTIWEDHFYPEIIDPETGAVLPDGQEGELVFTSLTKEALPIIRYRTRDLTRLLPGTARTMRRMQKITGRTDDMMIIRGVNVFPTQPVRADARGAAGRAEGAGRGGARSGPAAHRRPRRRQAAAARDQDLRRQQRRDRTQARRRHRAQRGQGAAGGRSAQEVTRIDARASPPLAPGRRHPTGTKPSRGAARHVPPAGPGATQSAGHPGTVACGRRFGGQTRAITDGSTATCYMCGRIGTFPSMQSRPTDAAHSDHRSRRSPHAPGCPLEPTPAPLGAPACRPPVATGRQRHAGAERRAAGRQRCRSRASGR